MQLERLSVDLHAAGLEATLLDLVEIRASQLNGCAFCIDMHSKSAKLHGERELRLYALPAWRESPLFTDRERAALAWTEALTRIDDSGVPDEPFEQARSQFSESELVDLTLVISVINAWNRLNVAFRPVPGSLDVHLGLSAAGLR
ncbi:MAG: carboxymuconolactone decarboxylase family protein [Planctomycetota bacterium]